MLTLTVITSLALYALGMLQQENMLLHPIRKRLDRIKLPYWLTSPLYSCPPCMSSIWGSGVWFLSVPDPLCFDWPIFVLSTSAVTYLIIYNFPYND